MNMSTRKKMAGATAHVLLAIVIVAATAACKKDDKETTPTTPATPVTTEPVESHNVESLSTGTFSNPVTVYFNFATNSVVPASDSNTTNWDISFRRSVIRLNGGVSGPGNAALVIRADTGFNELLMADESGYKVDGEGTEDPLGATSDLLVFNNWFDYENSTLTPKNQVYVIRTANNKYLKMEIQDYYYPGTSNGGFYTFRYTYQPGGSKVLN
jgi:hypothetical protein